MRRILAGLLVLGLIFSQQAFALEPVETETAAMPDPETSVRAIVLFEGRGTAAGEGLLAEAQDPENVQAELEEAVPELQVAYEFSALFSGVSVDVPYGDLDALREVEGVSEVWMAASYEAPVLLDAEESGDSGLPYTMPETPYTGEGTLIAVLDTGINFSHEAFAVHEGLLGSPSLTKTEMERAGTSVQGTYVSAKIPFAYDYAEKDGDVTDHNGHGSHVAGIAAGCTTEADGGITFSGAAPGAQLAIMKIFTDSSAATTSDVYFAALEDAYLLGADVVNMSFGTVCGFTYDQNLDSALFGNIYKTLDAAGVIVCCAAGNNGSQADNNSYSTGSVLADYADYGTVCSPSTYLGNLSVASATAGTNLQYTCTLGDVAYPYSEPFGFTGTFAKVLGGKTTEYVLVPGVGTQEDYQDLQVSGKIALVQRGGITFAEKARHAFRAGAVGIIIYSNSDTQVTVQVEELPIPMAIISAAGGSALAGATDRRVYISKERTAIGVAASQRISTSSSWGTTPDLTIAPGLSAAGSNILSAGISGDDSYRYSGGTSMATPKVAGDLAVLLSCLKEAAPKLTKVQRAQTAEQLAQSGATILGTESLPVSVRKQGAGVISVENSLDATAYIVSPIQELGDDPEETGVYKMTLTLKSTDTIGMECAADLFSDVSESDWFHKETDYVVHQGIFRGTGGDTFSPLRELTRAEAVTVLYRMAGEPEPLEESSFVDVPSGAYYENAVAWAQQTGVTQGTGGNRFSPDTLLTREQLVTMLHRFLGQPEGQGNLNQYLDGKTPEDYALEAWKWAVGYGIVTSTRTDLLMLSPLNTATRAELAALVYRILGGNQVAASYTPFVAVYSDTSIGQSDGTKVNPMTLQKLDCTVEYSVDAPLEFTPDTPEQTITVTIRLTEQAKQYLKAGFPNGTYVEGFVGFTSGDETIHATFLSFFGDWEEAPVLEQTDFRQVAAAEDQIRKEMPDSGVNYYDLLPVNIGANMAQLYCSNKADTTYYGYALGKLGDNIFSTSVDYLSQHMAIPALDTDADMTRAQKVLVRTMSLRNAEQLIFTVRDANTGTVYQQQVKPYVSKSSYNSKWGYSGVFYWSPTDQNGQPLPSGTQVVISVSAAFDGEAAREEWSFPCKVDGQAPEVQYALEGDTLTVTAMDKEYLASVVVTDQEGTALAAEYYSDKTAGQSHSFTVDLSQASGTVVISAADYATNVRTVTVTD